MLDRRSRTKSGMEKLQARARVRVALWGKLERKPPPEATQGLPGRLTLCELVPAAWAGGQNGDTVPTIPRLYSYFLGRSAVTLKPRSNKNVLTRAPVTQCGKATEASEEALASVHKAFLPSFQHGAASATCPRWPGWSPLQQEQDPALTPWSKAKDNLGEQWLHSPLPCPCRSSFWKLLDFKQRSMPTQSFPSVAHNFWKYNRCAWAVSRHKTVNMRWVYFF